MLVFLLTPLSTSCCFWIKLVNTQVKKHQPPPSPPQRLSFGLEAFGHTVSLCVWLEVDLYQAGGHGADGFLPTLGYTSSSPPHTPDDTDDFPQFS